MDDKEEEEEKRDKIFNEWMEDEADWTLKEVERERKQGVSNE